MRSRPGTNARQNRDYDVAFVGMGHSFPSDLVDNDTYLSRCQFHITDDPAQLARETQLKTRTWCTDDENTWTMAREAVDMALAQAGLGPEDIDVVLVASGTTIPIIHPAEKEYPGMADLAPLVLRHLGRPDALGMDIKACYCTGFLRTLQVADALLSETEHQTALVIATEQGSRYAVSPENRSTFCFIMSDAAGAAILRRVPRSSDPLAVGLIDHIGYTDATKYDWVGIGHDARSSIMRGQRAGAATHEMLVTMAQDLLARNGLTAADVDWLLPIQTHAGVIAGVTEALAWPAEKLLWHGDTTGFAGSSSIPSALSQAIQTGEIKRGQLILSIATGAGLNAGGALYRV